MKFRVGSRVQNVTPEEGRRMITWNMGITMKIKTIVQILKKMKKNLSSLKTHFPRKKQTKKNTHFYISVEEESLNWVFSHLFKVFFSSSLNENFVPDGTFLKRSNKCKSEGTVKRIRQVFPIKLNDGFNYFLQ